MMWGTLWGIVFLTSLLLFAAVAALVSVAGFRDVQTMFRRLREEISRSKSTSDE